MKEAYKLFNHLSFKEKIVCVTGGNGFIGKKLIEELIKTRCRLRVLTRKTVVKFPKDIEVFVGDLTDKNFSLEDFIKNCDILYHCAGETNNEALMSSVHINGTQKLIEAIKNQTNLTHKKLHWIQLSSCGAYGPPNNRNIQIKRLITETSDTNPVNEYERTKTKSDEMVIKLSDDSFSYTILRPSNVFGPSMKNKSINKLIKLVSSGYFFFIGKKDALSTYVHVDDVVKALLVISCNSNSKNEIFNISNDCSWEDLLQQIAYLLNVKILPIRIPFQLIQFPIKLIKLTFGKFFNIPQLDPLVFRTKYSTKKIESILNFKFSKPMPDAIEDLIKQKK